jgi:hypothetical protein
MNCLKTGLLLQGQEPVSGALDGELVGGTDNLRKILQKLLTLTNLQDATSWEFWPYRSGAVLTAYGVQGGVITYEDGSSARFFRTWFCWAEILSFLVSESVPSIEEKYTQKTR